MSYTLPELRAKQGLTQVELAKALGVTSGAVANWEVGTRVPKVQTLRRIATLFGVPIEQIRLPGESKATDNAGNPQPPRRDAAAREESAS